MSSRYDIDPALYPDVPAAEVGEAVTRLQAIDGTREHDYTARQLARMRSRLRRFGLRGLMARRYRNPKRPKPADGRRRPPLAAEALRGRVRQTVMENPKWGHRRIAQALGVHDQTVRYHLVQLGLGTIAHRLKAVADAGAEGAA